MGRSFLAFVTAWTLASSGCKDTPPPSPDPTPDAPRPLRVTADGEGFLFSYRTEPGGAFATATSIAEIPEAARKSVVVTDLSKSPEERQAGHFVHVADLTARREDGSYPVAIASRFGFESARPAATADPSGSAEGVVVYTASWCGVCRRAKRFLSDHDVPFAEKDIEASRAAREELGKKAAARGVDPGGVPVIDVAGELLLGLDEEALESALRRKGLLK